MTTLEKMDELCDEMDSDTSISEIFALLEAIYRWNKRQGSGHTGNNAALYGAGLGEMGTR